MHHCVRSMLTEEEFQPGSVGQIPNNQACFGMDRCPVTLRQIIKYDHLCPLSDQLLDNNTTNIAGTAGDQDFHKDTCASLIMGDVPKRVLIFNRGG